MPMVHTDRAFEGELRAVREALLRMAGRVERMVADALRALRERDAELARRTRAEDAKVNLAEIKIDEQCLVILARRQPLASDLRFLALALKMVTDLERIGDLAVNICDRALDLMQCEPVVLPDDVLEMGRLVQAMVGDAIDAFVTGDPAKAEAVIERDNRVDELYHTTFRALLARMRSDVTCVDDGVAVQAIVKWLERVGDHATNLAELVIYMVRGTDVRHAAALEAAQ